MGMVNNLMNNIAFLKNFMKDVEVGAVCPTSPFAVRQLCRKIDFDKACVIVEYGPGTGVFADSFLKKMTAESKLILIETNSEFCKILKCIKDPRLRVFQDSAENISNILNECGEDSADYIVSGIPLSLISKKVKQNIIANTRGALSGNGKFLVYQYSTFARKYLSRYFKRVIVDFVPFNIPPIFIFEVHNHNGGVS